MEESRKDRVFRSISEYVHKNDNYLKVSKPDVITDEMVKLKDLLHRLFRKAEDSIEIREEDGKIIVATGGDNSVGIALQFDSEVLRDINYTGGVRGDVEVEFTFCGKVVLSDDGGEFFSVDEQKTDFDMFLDYSVDGLERTEGEEPPF